MAVESYGEAFIGRLGLYIHVFLYLDGSYNEMRCRMIYQKIPRSEVSKPRKLILRKSRISSLLLRTETEHIHVS